MKLTDTQINFFFNFVPALVIFGFIIAMAIK